MDIAVEALAGSGNRSTRCVDCFCVAYNIDFWFAIASHILQYLSYKHDEREKQSKDGRTMARHAPQAMVVTAQTESFWNATYFLGGRIPGITSQLCCGIIDKTETTNPPNKIHSGSRGTVVSCEQ